jgi:hypothetical protein
VAVRFVETYYCINSEENTELIGLPYLDELFINQELFTLVH